MKVSALNFKNTTSVNNNFISKNKLNKINGQTQNLNNNQDILADYNHEVFKINSLNIEFGKKRRSKYKNTNNNNTNNNVNNNSANTNAGSENNSDNYISANCNKKANLYANANETTYQVVTDVKQENFFTHRAPTSDESDLIREAKSNLKIGNKYLKRYLFDVARIRAWSSLKAQVHYAEFYNCNEAVELTGYTWINGKRLQTEIFAARIMFMIRRLTHECKIDWFYGNRTKLQRIIIGRDTLRGEEYDADEEFILGRNEQIVEHRKGIKTADGIKKIDVCTLSSPYFLIMEECYKNLVLMPDGTKYYDLYVKVNPQDSTDVLVSDSKPCPKYILDKFDDPSNIHLGMDV